MKLGHRTQDIECVSALEFRTKLGNGNRVGDEPTIDSMISLFKNDVNDLW